MTTDARALSSDARDLSPQDEQIAVWLARGASIRRAAAQAGCCARTVTTRLRSGVLDRRVNELRAEITASIIGQLTGASKFAAARLRELAASEDEHVAIRACAVILESSLRFRSFIELEGRISAIENTRRARA